MANPQTEDGFIRVANELWDALTSIRIPGESRQVLDFIIRKTWGWGKKTDKIALSQFCDATGLLKTSVIKSRKKLLKMNLITVTQKGNDGILSYGFVKDYHKWKPLPKKVTLPKSKTTVTQKGNKPLPKKVHTKDTIKDTITKDRNLVERQKTFNDLFWPVYPTRKGKKGNKKESLKLFLKIPKKKTGDVLIGVRNYAVYCRDTDTWPKDSETWLRKQSWETWQTPYEPDHPNKQTLEQQLEEIEREEG